MPQKLVLTATETAEVLGISKSAVEKMVRRGDLPRVDYSGMRILRIPRAAVEKLVADAMAEAQAASDRLDEIIPRPRSEP